MHADATRTLLLNQGYEPIKVISWQRAITLLTLDKVDVVEEYDAQIRATSMIIQVPAVRPPTTITGLTPGTTYAFQAQALTNDGLGDWSDSVTIMCT